MYLVKYSRGSDDDYSEIEIFVTENEETAIKYTERFNILLNKWLEYYKQFECEGMFGLKNLKEEYFDMYYDRWYIINKINKCYYIEIDFR